MSINFFVSILLCSFANVLSNEELSCNLQGDNSYDGIISVTYDREELSIYKYNSTKFVNFLLRDLQVKFNGKASNARVYKRNNRYPMFVGKFNSDKEIDISGIQSDIEGIGKLEKSEEELTNCHLILRKNAKFVDNVHLSIQVRILELAHACIKPKLCRSLGSPQQDDYIRAKIDRYDFAENSIMYEVFAEKYPNLNLPRATENNLQHTINLLADFWLASLITQSSKRQLGQIVLPDVRETISAVPMINRGYFRLNDGTFGNLRNFTRSKDVIINHKGIEFSLEGEYKLPEAYIHFNRYAIKYGLLGSNGKIDIKINGVTFYVKAIINYNSFPCKIAVSAVKSNMGHITFKLSENGVIDSVINEVTTNIVNRYIPNLISLVETKIKEAIKKPLENFACEQFRP